MFGSKGFLKLEIIVDLLCHKWI